MDHTVTIHLTDDKTDTMPSVVDDVIAIAKKVQQECHPGDFELVFTEAMKTYRSVRGYVPSGELAPAHSQE